MKLKAALTIFLVFLANLASAATLSISGTVVDKGIRFQSNNKVLPMQNTEMKIYVTSNTSSDWKELKGPMLLSQVSQIRVVAP